MTAKATAEHREVSAAELARHNSKHDCWVAVHSKVWDLTDFVDEHPGGAGILLSVAGRDASAAYDRVHAPGIIEETLAADKLQGLLAGTAATTTTAGDVQSPSRKADDAAHKTVATTAGDIPALQSLLSAQDMEAVASKALTPKTWAFYSSAATDLVTHRQNKAFLRRVMLRPRILRNVKDVDASTTMLGHRTAAPFFISPAAMARLAHPDGELALAQAAGEEGIIQCISNNAAFPLASIVRAGADPSQTFFLQLYVNAQRHKTAALLQRARALGVKAIFVTVDAPVAGKREADERLAVAGSPGARSAVSGATATDDAKGGGLGRLMGAYIDATLAWADIAWVADASGGLPVVLKGVQSVEDARLAARTRGVRGIMLSNHGGRSLDTTQPAILLLLELRLKCPEIFATLEVYVDGGFERGADMLKAIALGATAVGLGRPFLYSLVYGRQGARHLIRILKDELETSMRLCGVTRLGQATPELLNTAALDGLVRAENRFPAIPAAGGHASRL